MQDCIRQNDYHTLKNARLYNTLFVTLQTL